MRYRAAGAGDVGAMRLHPPVPAAGLARLRGALLALASEAPYEPGHPVPPDLHQHSPPPGADDPDALRMRALVTLAQQGDGEAFGQIYDRYVSAVYGYLYARVGSQPVAEDLTSDTFLRALRRIDSFSWQGHDLRAWLFTIARNLVIDHVKSSRFRLEVPTADLLDLDPGDDGIEDTVLGRLRAAALGDAIRQLGPDQQECLVLRFLQGLSIAETAAVMGRSQGAVKQLQLRSVRALAKILDEQSR